MPGKLRVIQGPDLGRDFPLPPGEVSAGRDPEHAICLTDRSSSRTHFLLQVSDVAVRLIDMGSRNATLVNGAPVREHELRDGDVIEVGRTRLQFVAPPSPPGSGAPTPVAAAVGTGPGGPVDRALRALASAESSAGLRAEWDAARRDSGGTADETVLARLEPVAARIAAVLGAREAAIGERERLLDSLREECTLLGESPAMAEVRRQAVRASAADSPVLVAGEPGTGKRRAARSIHFLGPRAARGWHELDCRTRGEDVAVALESAGDGTCFLAHVERIPPRAQAALVQRLAGGVGARVIASTTADLEAEARAGRWREDLYFRLSSTVLRMPPLRDHPQDLLDLARGFGADAIPDEWGDRAWPGNVRELALALASLPR